MKSAGATAGAQAPHGAAPTGRARAGATAAREGGMQRGRRHAVPAAGGSAEGREHWEEGSTSTGWGVGVRARAARGDGT